RLRLLLIRRGGALDSLESRIAGHLKSLRNAQAFGQHAVLDSPMNRQALRGGGQGCKRNSGSDESSAGHKILLSISFRVHVPVSLDITKEAKSRKGSKGTMDKVQGSSDRREFLKTATGAIGGALAIGFPAIISGQTVTNAIKVGLVGCGGRGTGAASQALHADDYNELTAMADVEQSQIDNSLATLGRISKIAERVKVEKPRQFLGLNAYQQLIDSGVDVVLLATPPGFRPVQLAACINGNKHVFCEKPISTDAPGVRSVMQTAEDAKSKKLSLVAGFCWRYNDMIIDTFKQMSDGAIGKTVAYYATYYTNPVKPMPPASARPAGMSDTEW